MTTTVPPILEVQNLSVEYRRGRRRTLAVDDVSLQIAPRETLGLVGESGSGKSTIGKAVLGLVRPSSGVIKYDGRDILSLSKTQRRALTKELQVIYQDPHTSLDPTKPIGYSIAEPVQVHEPASKEVVRERVFAMLRRVGLSEDAARRFPAQFSGGQKQRIAIARALILSPRLVVCDEPVSALDLSIQAEVINLMAELQHEMGASYLFISHDLSIVHYLSDRIAVLKQGRIVEQGDAGRVYEDPQREYTQRLLAAAPVPDPELQAQRNAAREKDGLDARTDAIASTLR
ncbi:MULTISPECIES: ATP-binding cassette domain-containing protein [Microbacterium]|uniref:ABC transporter ATP-binding protein n=1 Tax=Microbacterium wangchenii TaxID=2541726 RepID=A0ABX5SUA8_9MICO|nr:MULTISPECIES: ATP-binding cassette domain-containing protein [Microbacterium]MCK6067312.1 ATP-binding cassette domain-containing protein [Microbacterium sp. EYE_512]QBR89746.1 ABC transporter ATP-binding protein [Microbacterium wangchenii]TFV85395.1 ABC transporter ATP-binding protein [Microbacterium sp. dk485]TXK16656.1 ABC transporter ATP-binding protein [Microbacterium wangchenii]